MSSDWLMDSQSYSNRCFYNLVNILLEFYIWQMYLYLNQAFNTYKGFIDWGRYVDELTYTHISIYSLSLTSINFFFFRSLPIVFILLSLSNTKKSKNKKTHLSPVFFFFLCHVQMPFFFSYSIISGLFLNQKTKEKQNYIYIFFLAFSIFFFFLFSSSSIALITYFVSYPVLFSFSALRQRYSCGR